MAKDKNKRRQIIETIVREEAVRTKEVGVSIRRCTAPFHRKSISDSNNNHSCVPPRRSVTLLAGFPPRASLFVTAPTTAFVTIEHAQNISRSLFWDFGGSAEIAAHLSQMYVLPLW
jgi:hypothetical protein